MTKISKSTIQNLNRRTVITGLVLAVIFVIVGNLVFSYALETLDVQAELLELAAENLLSAPFPEYIIPGLEENVWASILLGIVATFVIFAVTLLVAGLLRKDRC
jgi:ABC-type Fe3+ transport system permease subunit